MSRAWRLTFWRIISRCRPQLAPAASGRSSIDVTASRIGFSGVRSSWLSTARNWSLAWLASSASSLGLPQGLLGPLPLDAQRDLLGDRLHRPERGPRERVAGEHRPDADQPVLDHQRISGEGDHPLPLHPLLGRDTGVADDRVGQVWPPLPGDQADLELANRDAGVRAVDVRVHPGAGAQLQRVARPVERPDPGECPVQVPDGQFGAAIEHLLQRVALGEGLADVPAELGEPPLLLDDGLLPPPLGDVPED